MPRLGQPVKLSHDQYVEMVRCHNPTLKVISPYKGRFKKVRIEDKNGIVYSIQAGAVLVSQQPTIRVAENKTETFKFQLSKISPELEVVSEYIKGNQKILIKDKLGITYKVKPEQLLQGHPPTIKAAVDKNIAFITKAKQVHGDLYGYSHVEYDHSKRVVKIICQKHGVFPQRPNTHLNGAGCMACHYELRGGWSKNDWITFTNGKVCKFYIIECFNKKERFIKIGITSSKIRLRYNSKKDMPYKFKYIHIKKGTGEEVWNIEKTYLADNRINRYWPKIKFKGHRECFKIAA